MSKRSKEWREKISKNIKEKWKEKEYREKQMESMHSEEYKQKKSEEMKEKWDKDEFRERMTGESHPNWNPNREEVQKPYGPGWYGKKAEHINSLREEQGNRDALTGDKFKDNDTLVRHHIDYDKSNNDLNNLSALTPETHAKVHNESTMSREEYMKTFQEGKENLKQGLPPEHWDEENKEDYKNERIQEKDPISEGNIEETSKSKSEEEDKIKESLEEDDKESIKEDPEEKAEENGEEPREKENEEKKETLLEEKVEEPLNSSEAKKSESAGDDPPDGSERDMEGFSDQTDVIGPVPIKEDDTSPWVEDNPSKETEETTRNPNIEDYPVDQVKDYDGIDNYSSEESNDYEGIDEFSDGENSEFEGLGEESSSEGKDFDGVDEPSSEGGKDYDGIDESSSEGDDNSEQAKESHSDGEGTSGG